MSQLAPDTQAYSTNTESSPHNDAGASAPSRELPLVSVVVRSYRRPKALFELVERLRTQSYPRFEVVILEQSNDPGLVEALNSLNDSRLQITVSPALNPPAARNAAIRKSRGDILLFVDDDDLPIQNDWIDHHLANYWDPRCMGVVGRLVSNPENPKAPRFPRLLRALAMRFTPFYDTRGYAHNTLRKVGIDFLIGSNSSVRRSLVERIGGWDEGIPMNEEQSFSIRFARLRAEGEHFTFDPRPMMWRRTDIAGGLDRRNGDAWYLRELEARLFYYRHVVGYYFPRRYLLLRPLFWPRAVLQVLEWIWDPDNRNHPFFQRLRASLDLILRGPTVLRGKRFSAKSVRRMSQWT